MKTHTKYLLMNTEKKIDFANIIHEVESAFKEPGIKEGLAPVNAMRITSSIFINDNEGRLLRDFGKWLEELSLMDANL